MSTSVNLTTNVPPRKRVRTRVFIDNRDVTDVTTSPYKFRVSLPDIGATPFRVVESVELKSLAFPKVASEDYVIVTIDELADERVVSTNQTAEKCFAVMYFDASSLTTGDIKPMRGVDHWQKDLVFDPPLAKLSTLTISFKNRSGAVITSAVTNGVTRCSFMLEVTTLDVGYERT